MQSGAGESSHPSRVGWGLWAINSASLPRESLVPQNCLLEHRNRWSLVLPHIRSHPASNLMWPKAHNTLLVVVQFVFTPAESTKQFLVLLKKLPTLQLGLHEWLLGKTSPCPLELPQVPNYNRVDSVLIDMLKHSIISKASQGSADTPLHMKWKSVQYRFLLQDKSQRCLEHFLAKYTQIFSSRVKGISSPQHGVKWIEYKLLLSKDDFQVVLLFGGPLFSWCFLSSGVMILRFYSCQFWRSGGGEEYIPRSSPLFFYLAFWGSCLPSLE